MSGEEGGHMTATEGDRDLGVVLGNCVTIAELASRMYGAMARATDDPELHGLLDTLSSDELRHMEWWQTLGQRNREGCLPRALPNAAALAAELGTIVAEIEETMPPSFGGMSPRDMLVTAAKVEYFALEPVINELIDLLDATSGEHAQEQYDEHLERLLSAVERRREVGDALSAFLIRTVRRAWHNNKAMVVLATHDSLTGLYNRRALDAHLAQWATWACRYGRPLCVCMTDIDHFKAVNDTYGHAAGDRAIVSVADGLMEAVRSSDIVARYGGDEFLIIAPETDLEAARILRSRLATMPSGIGAQTGANDVVTLSVGMVVIQTPPGSEAWTNDEILAAVDANLYESKAARGSASAVEPVVLSRG
jgi:diguanylate cyclase (GGDEF)-like protein